MRRARVWAGLGAAALAAACRSPGPGPAPPPAQPSPAAPAAAAAAAPAGATRAAYDCDDGRLVRAAYLGPRAWLEVDGRSYAMTTALSGSGARYVGEGLQWWTRGMDQGRLSRLAPGETIAADPGVACEGLATPVTATTPQAAARVVRRYYALLAEGDAAAAARLRSDGAAPPTAEAAGLRAEVGPPGAPEGAAGSIYVEVPARLRLQDGAGAVRRARVVLRRVDDVPGATPDQLRWRIERIEISPGG
jgi:membrane-bound inhibitor of C-type lysozyme